MLFRYTWCTTNFCQHPWFALYCCYLCYRKYKNAQVFLAYNLPKTLLLFNCTHFLNINKKTKRQSLIHNKTSRAHLLWLQVGQSRGTLSEPTPVFIWFWDGFLSFIFAIRSLLVNSCCLTAMTSIRGLGILIYFGFFWIRDDREIFCL